MPRGDGTGPMGSGPLTGRGLGACKGAMPGYGAGYGRGFGRRGLGCSREFYNYANAPMPATDKQWLLEHKKRLEASLEAVNKSLEEQ